MDCPSAYTVSHIGARKTYSKSTGKEKAKLSTLLSSSADGVKLKPLTVVPRKRRIDALEGDKDMNFVYNSKGTFDGEIIIEHFINNIFKKHLSDNNIRKSLVILDRATCHTTLMFKEAFNKLGIKIFFIPANCTGILQPADVS